MEGKPKLDLSKYMIDFGAYALVYICTRNTMEKRATSYVAVKPSNSAGGYYFTKIYTRNLIHG